MNCANISPTTYGRLGTAAIVSAQMTAARKAGAIITEDKAARTVVASTPDGRLCFRAIAKGAGKSAPWIVIYSTEFFPKPGEVQP